MPLPENPLVLNGGCNCGAIRYKIDIPEKAKRPLHPLSNGEVTFPVVLTDHCNDCRKATGSILPTWICVPITMMTCKLEPVTAAEDDDETTWFPVDSLFYPGPSTSKYWLKFYKSSDRATRSFCGRCGTNLTYSTISSSMKDFPKIFDVVLGTIDRADLEKDWMAPDRHCWVSCEIEWIKELTNGAPSMPRHPSFKLDEHAE
ncbi:hypothetical protein LSUE1_G006291 [Lachnellula suecica]|uniref:CENP-V/GFA domain-containing protein n=1 Tax=Lachnellula suecica TaxID=602035 RepID=A0A8T9C9N2_9HELO|nr:hypothetical protein LSUE1_G006291 [Lachnellula suecica]